MFDTSGFVTAFWILVAVWVCIIYFLYFLVTGIYSYITKEPQQTEISQKDTQVTNCSISGNNNISFSTTGKCTITCDSTGALIVNCKD